MMAVRGSLNCRAPTDSGGTGRCCQTRYLWDVLPLVAEDSVGRTWAETR